MKELVTIKAIARRLGVSPSTVSRALQDHPRISLHTREAVHTLARQLNYFPSTTARNLKSGKTGIIAVVLPEIRENFFSEIINGIEELAFDRGYTVALYQSHDKVEREERIFTGLASQRVDGILVSVAKETQRFGHIQSVIDRQIPVVLVDRIPPGIAAHRVGCDMERGAYEATKWLAGRGYKRIALLNGPIALVASEDRYRGYVTALLEENLPVENALIKRVDLTTPDITEKMNQLLQSATRPDAVLAFNDYVALDAMRACRAQHLRINVDVGFVSFANLPLTAYMDPPPLASVEQHPFKMGVTAVEILLATLADNSENSEFQTVMLAPELIVSEAAMRVQEV